MNLGRFGSAFAVEMETVQSEDSSLNGSEDELARTKSEFGIRLFFAILSILADRSIPIDWSHISLAFSRNEPVPQPISRRTRKCLFPRNSSMVLCLDDCSRP